MINLIDNKFLLDDFVTFIITNTIKKAQDKVHAKKFEKKKFLIKF